MAPRSKNDRDPEARVISIRGAREHNLKNVDLDMPRDQLIVITGLSGSGKSSLAFDTIYAEGQRRYVEVAVGLCAPVPRDDAEAGRRPDRRPVAGDLDRAEDHLAQPALDRRHGHRDLRLHAPAVRARRRPLFAGDRPADREPDRQPDGRPRAGAAGGHAALSAGADRARPQGRVPQGTRRAAEEGLPARQDRRQVLRDRRGARARQEVQARHRRGGRPHRGAPRHRHAAGRQLRDGAGARRRHRHRRVRRYSAPSPPPEGGRSAAEGRRRAKAGKDQDRRGDRPPLRRGDRERGESEKA